MCQSNFRFDRFRSFEGMRRNARASNQPEVVQPMSNCFLPAALVFALLALPLVAFAEGATSTRRLPTRNKGKAPINKPTPLPQMSPTAATLATLEFPLDQTGREKLTVTKVRRADGIFLTASDRSSRTVWTSTNLGSDEKKFFLDDKTAVLGMKDFTGDARPELVSSAFYGPSASGLFIYAWDAKKRTFTSIPNTASGSAEPREHLVSDIPVETGDDMVVDADGTIRLLGRVFDPKAENPPGTGIYVYRFQKGAFTLQQIEVLPAPPDLK